MARINDIRTFITEQAELYGAKLGTDTGSLIERNKTSDEVLKTKGAYFGFIHPEEERSGPYHDFSLIIFPSADDRPWLVSLCVGSSGFKHDYELASYPGVRRLFAKLIDENGFCKSDFTDIESSLPKSFIGHEGLQHLQATLKMYTKFLPACQIINNPDSTKGKAVIAAFIAAYAKLREWPSNNNHRKALSTALAPCLKEAAINDLNEVESLLQQRKYVVLQGAPGTGKTTLAKQLATKLKAKTFFTQFHAETSFSDFIYGIRPSLNDQSLSYTLNIGCFPEAVEYARDHENEPVILIIDEINRANLANVLGPVFYLFEHKMQSSDVSIALHPKLSIKQLPNNLHVIATMNTADRSLAVVDFALRRRFAWYTLTPKVIKAIDGQQFYQDDFNKIQEIFAWSANSDELQLQPGQGYFIAADDEEMQNRVRYELYPLICEYLQEGLLQQAKEAFNHYFVLRINQSLVI